MKKSNKKTNQRIKKLNEQQRKKSKNKNCCKYGGHKNKICEKNNNALYKPNDKYGCLFDGYFRAIKNPIEIISNKNPKLGAFVIITIAILIVIIVSILADSSNEIALSILLLKYCFEK